LFGAVAKLGTATVRRAYGNWASPSIGAWKAALQQHAIQAIHQYNCTAGKNTTDIALIIDAMDLLHGGRVDGFCLVASDGDYSQLAVRIRTQGLPIHGFGLTMPHPALVAACTAYTRLGLSEPSQVPAQQTNLPEIVQSAPTSNVTVEPMEATDLQVLLTQCVQAAARADGWAFMSTIGQAVIQRSPAFSVKLHGHATLTKLLAAQDYIQVEQVADGVSRARLVLGSVPPSDGAIA
jgi:hypothetical protein